MSVTNLPNSTTFTPEQSLQTALREVDKLEDVMVIGTYKDGCGLYITSSRLTRAEALWLAEKAKKHALDQ